MPGCWKAHQIKSQDANMDPYDMEQKTRLLQLKRLQRRKKYMPTVLLERPANIPKETEPECLHPIQREKLRDILKKAVMFGPAGNKLAEFFEAIDDDGSGTIDVEEMITGVRTVFNILPNCVPDGQIRALFRTLDDDDSGMIDCIELLAFVTAAQMLATRGYRQMIRPRVETVRQMCEALQEAAEMQNNEKENEEKLSVENDPEGAATQMSQLKGFEAAFVSVNGKGVIVMANKPDPPKPKVAPRPKKKKRAPERARLTRQEVHDVVSPEEKAREAAELLEQEKIEKEEQLKAASEEEERLRISLKEKRLLLGNKEALTQMLRDVIRTNW